MSPIGRGASFTSPSGGAFPSTETGDSHPSPELNSLVIVPVSASQVDVWATEGVLELAQREKAEIMVVLNRAKAGTRVADDVDRALTELGVTRAAAVLGHRVAFPETMGAGKGVLERGKGLWSDEIDALTDEVLRRVG